MAKIVMIGEEHFSKKLNDIGRAVKERLEKHKPSKYVLLVEGPFMLPAEKAALEAELPIAPTAPIWRFFHLAKGKRFDEEKLAAEKTYIDIRNLQDYTENMENIESAVFLLLPQIARFGMLERIDDYGKKFLETIVSMLNIISLGWEREYMGEYFVLGEYRDIAALSLKIRECLSYLENPPAPLDIFRLSREQIENINRTLSGLPPDMTDDILLMISKMRGTFTARSGIHAGRILEFADMNAELIITATGAAHIPGVVHILEREGKLDLLEEVVFTGEPEHERYAKSVAEAAPELEMTYL